MILFAEQKFEVVSRVYFCFVAFAFAVKFPHPKNIAKASIEVTYVFFSEFYGLKSHDKVLFWVGFCVWCKMVVQFH